MKLRWLEVKTINSQQGKYHDNTEDVCAETRKDKNGPRKILILNATPF
jgi:hypothetical protein